MRRIYPALPFLVASDSLLDLTAISDVYSAHPLVSRIHTLLSALLYTSYTVTFIRVSSHEGILGDEKVDSATKAATSLPPINSQILLTKANLSLVLSLKKPSAF